MDGKFGTHHISVSQTPGDQSQEMIWQAPLDGCQLRWEFPCPATKRGPKPKAGRKQKVRYRAIEDGKFRKKRRVVKLEGSLNGLISESRYWSEAMGGNASESGVVALRRWQFESLVEGNTGEAEERECDSITIRNGLLDAGLSCAGERQWNKNSSIVFFGPWQWEALMKTCPDKCKVLCM